MQRRIAVVIGLGLGLVMRAALPAAACKVSATPDARVFEPAAGTGAGLQPWIRLANVKGAVKVTRVPASCAADTICKGTAVAVDRTGSYLRPRAAQPAGARLQITQGRQLLEDITLKATAAATALPAWDGIALVQTKQVGEGLCSPAGTVVELKVKPTQASLDGAVLLVYFGRPDPAKPHAKLVRVVALGTEPTVVLENALGEKPWLTGAPKALWVTLADADGHVGTPIQLI